VIEKQETDRLLEETIDRFWETIPPVWNQIRGRIRCTAPEKFGISVEQFHILRHIRKGMKSVSELAVEKQISRSAISQAVDLLVDKGLITRKQSIEDRRYVQLELTQNGDELLNSIFQNNREWMVDKMADLTAEEMRCIITSFEILKKTFSHSER
jgi:DNA-binding MarR family transcriptional regulator